MTGVALALVLASAIAHATWNLLAKQVGGGVAFLWLFASLSVLIYAPLAGLTIALSPVHWNGWILGFIAGSALIHVGYFLLLQLGYRRGDLSLVYPLARGTGPLLSVAVAIAFFGERPSWLALLGAGLMAVSVVLMTGKPGLLVTNQSAIAFALLTGAFIAAYTLWDKYAVSQLLVAPLVYDWASNLGRVLLLAPAVWRQRDQVTFYWQHHRAAVLGIAILSPLSYILVLTALVASPVSYVAPTREVSILIGAVLGVRLLAEQDALRRIAAAGLMVVGVIFLAVG